MICRNCGADISEHLVVCPYCGTENPTEALKEHEAEVKKIEQDTEELKHLKEKIARQASRVTGYVAAGCVIFFLLLALSTYLFVQVRASHGLERQNQALEELEVLYNAGEYEEMYDYLETVDKSYSATFEKYSRVADLAHYYESDRQYTDSICSYVEEGNDGSEFLYDAMYYVFYDMQIAAGYREEGYPYGEEEGVEYYDALYRQILTEQLLLTEEEIDDTLGWMNNDTTKEDFLELAAKSQSRIQNQ